MNMVRLVKIYNFTNIINFMDTINYVKTVNSYTGHYFYKCKKNWEYDNFY